MTVKDKYVDVRYHMNTYKSQYSFKNEFARLSLKMIGRFIFTKARSYDKFKPYYSRVSFDGKYRMEC